MNSDRLGVKILANGLIQIGQVWLSCWGSRNPLRNIEWHNCFPSVTCLYSKRSSMGIIPSTRPIFSWSIVVLVCHWVPDGTAKTHQCIRLMVVKTPTGAPPIHFWPVFFYSTTAQTGGGQAHRFVALGREGHMFEFSHRWSNPPFGSLPIPVDPFLKIMYNGYNKKKQTLKYVYRWRLGSCNEALSIVFRNLLLSFCCWLLTANLLLVTQRFLIVFCPCWWFCSFVSH